MYIAIDQNTYHNSISWKQLLYEQVGPEKRHGPSRVMAQSVRRNVSGYGCWSTSTVYQQLKLIQLAALQLLLGQAVRTAILSLHKGTNHACPDLPKLRWTGRRSGPALWPSASLFKVALSISLWLSSRNPYN
jgi:hypothetical protein